MAALHVRHHGIPDGFSGPIVMSFPQGPPPPGGGAPPLALSYTRGASSKRAHQRTLAAEGASSSFAASNFGRAGGDSAGACRVAVCVLNPKRTRLDVFEVDGGGGVFALQADGARGLAARQGGEAAAGAAAAAPADNLEGKESWERRAALLADFGSKKKQRLVAAAKANVVTAEAVSAAHEASLALVRSAGASGAGDIAAAAVAVGGVGAGGGVAPPPPAAGGVAAAISQAGLEAARARVLPPFNRFASAPSDAYPVETLLPAEPSGAGIRSAVRALLKAAAPPPGGALPPLPPAVAASTFASERVAALLRAHADGALQKADAARRLACALYAAHLVALYCAGDRLWWGGGAEGEGGGGGGGAPRVVAPRAIAPGAAEALAADAPLLAHSLRLFTAAYARGEGGARTPCAHPPGGAAAAGVEFQRQGEGGSKLLAWLGVAALSAAEGWTLDLASLAKDLRVPVVELAKSFRELGCACAPVRGGGAAAGEGAGRAFIVSYTATLKAPLAFPALKKGGK
jgi:hypothetical protein